MMTKMGYIDQAWNELGTEVTLGLSQNDADAVVRLFRQCFEEGWELNDAVRYARFTEHVNPDISEEAACKRLAQIASKYRKGKG